MRSGLGGVGGVRRRAVLAVALALLATAGTAAPVAVAHETTPAGVQRLELSLGAQQVGLTVTLPPAGGGRAGIVVTPRGEGPPGPVSVAAARPGAPAGPSTVPTAAPGRRDGQTTLDLPGPGAWEVVVSDGAGLSETARVPVVVAPDPPVPARVWVFWAALLIGVASLITALGPTTRARPRAALPLGALAVAGLTVAATLVVVDLGGGSATAPAAAPAAGHDHAAMPAMPAMPAVEQDVPAGLGTSGAVTLGAGFAGPAPTSGSSADLVLTLTDASSGATVDDLTIHDEALIHLAVVGPDGALAHVHPVRVAPGRYAVRLTPRSGGRHGVFAEMQRGGGGGHQIARTAVDVPGAPVPASWVTAPAPAGPREVVPGLQADLAVSSTEVGRPATITATFSDAGRPVGDLQPWLGMAGHLMLLGPGRAGVPDPADPASAFGHVHDMSAAGPAGTYGPQVRFRYAFPREGRYALWVQVQRDRRVLTLPATVDVGPGTAP